MSGDFGLAPFLSAGVSPKGFRALLAVVLDVRLDRYQAAITCPIATSDSSRKVKQATVAGLLLRELRLRARRKWRGGAKSASSESILRDIGIWNVEADDTVVAQPLSRIVEVAQVQLKLRNGIAQVCTRTHNFVKYYIVMHKSAATQPTA